MKYGLLLLLIIPLNLFSQNSELPAPINQVSSSKSIDSLKKALSILKLRLKKASDDRVVLRDRLEASYNALQSQYDKAKAMKDSVDILNTKAVSRKEDERIRKKFDDVLTQLEKLTAESNQSEDLLVRKNEEIKNIKEKIASIEKQITDSEQKNQ